MEDLYAIVVRLLDEVADIEADIVSLTATFDEIGLDSLSEIDLCIAINRELGLDVDDEEMMRLSTVGEVVSLISDKLADAGHAKAA